MSNVRVLLRSARVWILIAFVILSIIAINPQFSTEGLMIRHVDKGSAAEQAGIANPAATLSLTGRERVLEVNGIAVSSEMEYYAALDGYGPDDIVRITTDRQTYPVTLRARTDAETNKTLGVEDLGLTIAPAARSNLRLGLDLSGGTRVVLRPKEEISPQDLEIIVTQIKERLNVYGLSDIVVRDAKDLGGQVYVIVEIAGANKDEVRNLLARQGKFEAKVSNVTVFRGGGDITSVCRTAECSGLDRQQGCGPIEGGQACRFSFQITLTPEAAQRQADATRDLAVVDDGSGPYLTAPLQLYLDDELVDELQISSDLKGKVATDILISGSGFGPTQTAAVDDTIANMKRLQTVLITGSLPVQLEIVKTDGISPAVGGEFLKNAFLLGALSILAVAIVVVARYRKPIIAIPIMVTMLAEVIIILGFAAAVGWNLDLIAIAAIIIAIGSGVDDQIVLIDETLHRNRSMSRSWKESIAAAFFIIFASYFTLASAMIPLFFAGAGLLRGFAITTLVGVTAGVLVTRPAFAQFIEALLKKDDEE